MHNPESIASSKNEKAGEERFLNIMDRPDGSNTSHNDRISAVNHVRGDVGLLTNL